jgi:hypothetical protein
VGVNYEFPVELEVPAGGYLLLVPFDPAVQPALALRFRAHYGLSSGISLVGPYAGSLAGSAVESLSLERDILVDQVESLPAAREVPR